MIDLQTFRHEKDHFFAMHPQSPLSHDQKHGFQGLEYFPENPDLRLQVHVERINDKEEVTIQTSTGEFQSYSRFGIFTFSAENKSAELTIFANEHGLFLPFVDTLRGSQTYPAGRYLEPEPLQNGRYLVDFNLAYNPYCAYNENFSCPLTPFENRLQVPIRAGEKIFPEKKNQVAH